MLLLFKKMKKDTMNLILKVVIAIASAILGAVGTTQAYAAMM